MTRNIEKVEILADGLRYTEWERIRVSYSMREACRSFQVDGTERPGQFRFPPGTAIQIFANQELLLDGYVNRYMPSGDASSHQVSIAGRSKSQDLVDCSAVHDTGFWENKTPDQIGQDLDQFGVGITSEVALKPVPYWQLYQGESPCRTLDRMVKAQGKALMGKADGSLAITDATVAQEHVGALVEGINILSYQGEMTDDRRHSDYMVKGQGRVGVGDEALRPFGQAIDSFVQRYRPLIVVNEGDTDADRATSRAENEKARAAGLSVAATVTTQGWRDEGGKCWEPNYKIFVSSPKLLHLVQEMLIEGVTLTQDAGQSGSLAELRLVDPAAYGGETSGGGGDSDAAWG